MTETNSRIARAGAAHALLLEGVSRGFGALVALDNIDLSVRAGGRRAILGANGAGKTTLFNAITGDVPPSAGRIGSFGEDVTQLPAYQRIRRGLRRTYQNSMLFRGLTVLDNLYVAARGVTRGRFSLRRAGATDQALRSARELVHAVHFLIPEGGVSLIDAPGQAFYDPEADQALFDTISRTFQQTRQRRLIRLPYNINDPLFSAALVEHFLDVIEPTPAKPLR